MKQVVYEIVLKNGQAITNAKELRAAVKESTEELTRLTLAGKDTSAVTRELGQLKAAQKDISAETRKATREFQIGADKGQKSYRSMQATLTNLKNEFKDLGEEAREGIAGQKLQTQIRNLSGELKGIDKSLGDNFRNVGNYGSALKDVGNLLTGGVLVAGATEIVSTIVEIGKESLNLFDIQEQAESRLLTALQGREEIQESLISQAQALQGATRFGDEAIIEQQAYLAALGFTEDQINAIINASLDLSEGAGLSLESSVKNLSKTYSGLTGELGEAIPALRDLSKEQLQAGGAVDLVAESFKGQAQAAAQAGTGGLQQLSNRIGDLKERFGAFVNDGIGLVLPALNKFFDLANEGFSFLGRIISPVVESFSKFFTTLFEGSNAGETFTFIFQLVGQVLELVANSIVRTVDTITILVSGVKVAAQEIPLLGKAIDGLRFFFEGLKLAILNIPALLNGVGSALKQTFDNITNFDFSNSIADAFQEGFNDLRIDTSKAEATADDAGIKAGNAFSEGVKNVITKGEGAKTIKEAAEGSIAQLRSEISKLKKEIETSNQPDNVIAEKLEEITEFSTKLAAAEENLLRLRGVLASPQIQGSSLPASVSSDGSSGLTGPSEDPNDIVDRLALGIAEKANEKGAEAAKSFKEGLISSLVEDEEGGIAENLSSGFDEAFSAVDSLISTVSDRRIEESERARDAEIRDLEAIADRRLENVVEGSDEEKAIQEQLVADREKINKKAFAESQKLRVKAALASGKLAAVQALANTTLPFPASLTALIPVGIQTAVSVAGIKAQQYAEGGKVGALSAGLIDTGQNIPTQTNGDNVLATVKRGEVILNKRQQAAIGGASMFRRIGVPGFNNGGIVGAIPEFDSVVSQSSAGGVSFSDKTIEMLASRIGEKTAEGSESGITAGFDVATRNNRRQIKVDDELGV